MRAKKKSPRALVDAIIPDVESLTLRAVAGDGEQIEILIRQRRGEIALRLLGRTTLRVIDLRRRDKQRRGPAITVPFLRGED